ncbi:hypothetical protein NC796_05755 [Aliifodinibius sp. S!AR15-10]|uniref:AraD1 family protein n=1 Tax=Aliifodinibius sp. S!AR15-10 TaxID=2950437 RepID=UPI002861FBF3|nr:AraD1 family protein [Aliifodinibius sp. S!AR15-10]MDR8390632.1 hypothetical protein [Aliifodinibius sp. S!AR15-10]
MRLIQLHHPEKGRRIAVVDEPSLTLVHEKFKSCYSLFEEIINKNHSASDFIREQASNVKLDYDSIYAGMDQWKILPAFDHPSSPLACMLSGTGLTHKASAENRQKMHEKLSENEKVTDSMEVYLWGEEGGKPEPGQIGVQPEWFFKGNGTALRGHGDPLHVPAYANDGGEEPEVAGIYLIGDDGKPYRIGFSIANEFSDHVMEKKNYLYLAPSKLRSPAIGPELVIDHDFQDIPGTVSIERDNEQIWAKEIKSGEQNMSHSLQNLEYHHFKYDQHRIPGMVHIHFFGADAFSFGENILLEDGDIMSVSFEGFGRSLHNPIHIESRSETLVTAEQVT